MAVLTEKEKAAICYHVFAGCDDKNVLFVLAEGEERFNRLKDNSKKTTVFNWFKSHRIQEGIKLYKALKASQENEIIQNYLKQGENVPANEPGPIVASSEVNFLDPEQFLQHANSMANKITDEKEKRSWLEMIAKLMNYKEKDDSENSEIRRFYIMKTCENCEIYQNCKNCTFASCSNVTI